MDVVRECAEAWEKLITGKTQPGKISLYVLVSNFGRPQLMFHDSKNVTVEHSPDRVQPGSVHVPAHQDLAPAPIDGIYDKWFFISGAAV